jgi:hypothetical protein
MYLYLPHVQCALCARALCDVTPYGYVILLFVNQMWVSKVRQYEVMCPKMICAASAVSQVRPTSAHRQMQNLPFSICYWGTLGLYLLTK